jgi:hypothetical protein
VRRLCDGVLGRTEQAYVDAYEGEGWRGANREKLRPTADLERARLRVRFWDRPPLRSLGFFPFSRHQGAISVHGMSSGGGPQGLSRVY